MATTKSGLQEEAGAAVVTRYKADPYSDWIATHPWRMRIAHVLSAIADWLRNPKLADQEDDDVEGLLRD